MHFANFFLQEKLVCSDLYDSLFYVFSCKRLRRNIWEINLWSNKFLILAWLVGILMLIAALYIPFLQTLLKTVPLNSFDWSLILILGFLNIFLIEITKSHYNRVGFAFEQPGKGIKIHDHRQRIVFRSISWYTTILINWTKKYFSIEDYEKANDIIVQSIEILEKEKNRMKQ